MTGHTLPESTNACPTSPTTDQPELLPVIQADCDAAASLRRLQAPWMDAMWDRDMRDGGQDADPAVQAFARHRLTSTTPTLGDMVMVPREPTEDMLTRGVWEITDGEPNRDDLADAYRAMLSAVPASPIPISVANEGEREGIARIIDADAMRPLEHYQAEWAKHFEIVLSVTTASDKVDVPAVRARLAQEEYDGMGQRRAEALSKAEAILALSPALDNTAVEGLTDEQYKRLGYKLTAPLSNWFIRNGDRTNPSAFINTDPAYFGMECGSFIAGIVRAAAAQTGAVSNTKEIGQNSQKTAPNGGADGSEEISAVQTEKAR